MIILIKNKIILQGRTIEEMKQELEILIKTKKINVDEIDITSLIDAIKIENVTDLISSIDELDDVMDIYSLKIELVREYYSKISGYNIDYSPQFCIDTNSLQLDNIKIRSKSKTIRIIPIKRDLPASERGDIQKKIEEANQERELLYNNINKLTEILREGQKSLSELAKNIDNAKDYSLFIISLIKLYGDGKIAIDKYTKTVSLIE